MDHKAIERNGDHSLASRAQPRRSLVGRNRIGLIFTWAIGFAGGETLQAAAYPGYGHSIFLNQESAPDDPPPKDQDLAKKLIHGANADASGVMGEIMELMDRSAERVGRDFDPGPATQQVQQAILDKLDQAIASARRKKSKSQSTPQSTGESRESQPPSQGEATPAQEGVAQQGEEPGVQKGQPAEGQAGAKPVREIRRSWGHLPFRDRDEILQGIDEDSVERFREIIEEYYRALAEDDKE